MEAQILAESRARKDLQHEVTVATSARAQATLQAAEQAAARERAEARI